MNKLFSKIAGLSIGLAMAIGVGVAVGSNSKEATPVHAAPAVSYDLDLSKASALSSRTPTGSYNYTTVYTLTMASGSRVFTAYGFNPNNYAVAGTRFGNKNSGTTMDKLTNGPTTGSNYVQYISTNATISDSITKVEITTLADFGSCTKGTGYVQVSANSNFSSSTNYSFTHAANSTIPVTISSPAANRYYRVVWQKASSSSNAGIIVSHIKFYYEASTPLTGITLSGTEVGGTSPNYTLANIAKSDTSTNHTVSVGLTPTTATDPKVKVEHYDGDNVVDVYSSPVTCTSGTGSFNVRAKGTAVGTERLKIYGNTETSVVRYLSVTVYDDSVTSWTVSFDSDGGASIADMIVEDGDTFEFPSPGTKTHYSFDGWSSDGGNTLYNAGATSPAVGDDIEYTAYWTQDAQTTVIYKSGDGTGSDISSTEYAGSYSLASFPGTWTAPSGKAFSKWSDGSSQYSAGANYTLVGNTTVTFTAVYKPVDEYTLFSGDLVEGDYVICSGTKAMKNETTSSPRIDVADVTVTNNKIVDPDASIIWHIAQDGDYWTIYNAAVEKYAAFTNTNGRGTLIDSVTDYARFSTDGSYEFINVGNSGKYLRYNPTYGFASYSSSTGVSLTLYKAPSNELSSIALSGDYKTSFPSGETFSFGGTVTASYTLNNPVNVTSSTTFHLDSANGTNMSGVTMTHAAHDGHTIYAKYTEGGITKTATYSISVANAPVSSLTIASNTGKVATKKLFDMSDIGVTISPADAVQTYEWTVLSNTVNNDYKFKADIVEAGNTEGTITLKCTSTADSSKYQTFVLTVSGNPIVTLPNSVTLYTGKTTTVTASVEGGTSPYTYSWSITSGGSNASISSGESSATVTLSGSAAGSVTLQCSVTDSNSKSDSASVTFSVTASAVTEVNWSASAFDVFSGATIPSNIDDTWEVNYEKNNGDADYITFGDYELYLGSKEITSLPYTFVAADDGKELHVEYGGVSSSSVAVAVTQTINDVNADITSETTWSHTISAKTWSAYGAQTINSKSWTAAVTSGGDNFGYDATKGQQFGKAADPCQGLTLSSSAFSETVSTVKVSTSGASSVNASISVTVGSTAFKSEGSESVTISATNTEYTFTGSATGTITISWNLSNEKALYLKALSVTTITSSGSQQIANKEDHKVAQRAVVKFAKAFNAAVAEGSSCSTEPGQSGTTSAWDKCQTAYSTFLNDAASDLAYAKNFIRYATDKYSDSSDEACVERMVTTYKILVGRGYKAFMSEIVSAGKIIINPLQLSIKNSSAVITVVAISALSLATIGGYFLFRKKKED